MSGVAAFNLEDFIPKEGYDHLGTKDMDKNGHRVEARPGEISVELPTIFFKDTKKFKSLSKKFYKFWSIELSFVTMVVMAIGLMGLSITGFEPWMLALMPVCVLPLAPYEITTNKYIKNSKLLASTLKEKSEALSTFYKRAISEDIFMELLTQGKVTLSSSEEKYKGLVMEIQLNEASGQVSVRMVNHVKETPDEVKELKRLADSSKG